MSRAKKQPNIVVQIAKDFSDLNLSLPKIKRLVKTICKRFSLLETTVNIAVVDDDEIRKVNKQFLNCNCYTDVISFDLSDEEQRLFEIIVNGQMAVREGKLRGHSSEAELALYITHGLLHNIGFDDTKQDQAKKMHDTENEILRQCGYGLVYNANIASQKAKKGKSIHSVRKINHG